MRQQSLTINLETSTYQLSSFPIITYSETITAEDSTLLAEIDYRLDYQTGKLTLLHDITAQYLFISYIAVPPELAKPLSIYERKTISDSLYMPSRRLNPLWKVDDSKLNISGSKTFALTFSDDDTFDLKQSLFVNLNGEIGDNIHILAQLSDSQSKLSPEGDSKELSSLDQVFIKVYGKQYELAMGDLEWEFTDTRFMSYQTKFEGVNLWYRDKHAVQAGYSASNGKRSSQKLTIVDGKQGPYYLSAGSYQQNFIVIAGSEKVYVDGSFWERGLDYSIDYAEGTIMFRKLVTSANNVTVHFQYSDENYKQSMFLNSSMVKLSEKLLFRHHIIHQTDDKRSPLQYEFSEADLDSLRAAGDSTVWGEGIFAVPAGAGTYIKRIATDGQEYYEYSPMDSLAAYNLVFSYVGPGEGSYEEYSSGKYRYTGIGNGSWLPRKRLIPPSSRSNFNSQLEYASESVKLALETVYTHQDKNTFSRLDDDDNDSYLLYAQGVVTPDWDILRTSFKLDLESRAAHSYLFGNYYDPSSEFQFNAIDSADSLAQYQTSFGIQSETPLGWKPELLLRYKSIEDYYEQYALRWGTISPSYGLIPELSLRGTVSRQVYADSTLGTSHLQYYQGTMSWKYKYASTNLDALWNSLTYSQEQYLPGTRYLMFRPSFSIGNQRKTLTNVSYQYDESSLKRTDWDRINSSDVYRLRHSSSFTNHNLDLDATHREIRNYQSETSNSNYDLVTFRSNHSFLKQALALLTNYQLNQTEFYPRIRELEYVGNGLGLYDSTGVYIPNGDYDYVYITSETGTLSTEINGQLNIYIKPAYIARDPFWQRLMTDISIQATEQNSQRNGIAHYFFAPGSVYTQESTIYGRQNYMQSLWIDIVRNRINTMLSYELNRSLDQRYQSLSRTYYNLKAMELELKNYLGMNYRLRYENRFETDTRYGSEIQYHNLGGRVQRNLNNQTALQADLDYSDESGRNSLGVDTYELSSIGIRPSIRSVLMQKYRFSAAFTLRHNTRSGSEYLSFLPDKREGFIGLWNLQAIYRLNTYTSATIEYSGNSYPKDKTGHQLKIEFKAEL